ncbi:MAG: GNAT family N-acetyltransferase [Bacilli bacterium]|nr:GNAT family N-acetyltransferase [Bacilli bacterium]
MNYEIIHDIKSEDIIYLREILGWKKISIEQFDKALNNTMYKVSIKNDKDIIACGRLIGDYSCKGLLSDILVNPKYQKQGFGKMIVCELLDMVKNNLKENEKFQIEASPTNGNREFYIKCGMKYKPENQDGVYIWLEK